MLEAGYEPELLLFYPEIALETMSGRLKSLGGHAPRPPLSFQFLVIGLAHMDSIRGGRILYM